VSGERQDGSETAVATQPENAAGHDIADWSPVDLHEEARRALREGRHAEAEALLKDLPASDIQIIAMRAVAAAGLGRRSEAYGQLDRHLAASPGDLRLLRAKQSAARLLDDRPMIVEVLLAILHQRHDLADAITLGLALKRLDSMPSHEEIWRRLSRGRGMPAHRRTMAHVLHEIGAPAEAAAILVELVNAGDPDAELLVEASARLNAADRRDEARQVTMAAINRFPIVKVRDPAGPAIRLLVLTDFMAHSVPAMEAPNIANSLGGGNFPSQLTLDGVALSYGIFNARRFAETFRPEDFDALLCNFAFNEARPADFMDRVDRFLAETPCAVLNHPRRTLALTRDANYGAHGGRDDIVFPRTERIDAYADRMEETIAWIEARFDYPVIVRPITSQRGGGAELVADRAALAADLAGRSGQPLYVIQFHACRRDWADRVLAWRVVWVGGALLPVSTFRFPSWTTHGPGPNNDRYRQDVLVKDTRFLEEDRAFQLDFERTVPAAVRHLLAERLARSGADICGMDFGYLEDGRPIIFEMNANMRLFFAPSRLPFMPYYVASDARIGEAILALIRRRVAAAPAGRSWRRLG